MIEDGPKQAITEELCAPHGRLEAQAGMFHFFQSRSLSDRQMHEVTFEDKTGRPMRWICHVLQEPDGTWHMTDGANITGTNHSSLEDRPIAHLSGSNLAHFWMEVMCWIEARR